jgi:tRNA pseudouridine32 synthase/23S rRNA pseudouridine746 synthase
VHLASLGIPIKNDPLYPEVQKIVQGDFSHPLQLLAKTLEFIDPFTGERQFFESEQTLSV